MLTQQADTTARDALCRMPIDGLRDVLHRVVRSAQRRKALSQRTVPLQAVALDGKTTVMPALNHPLVQDQHFEVGLPRGLVRTVTFALVSAPGRLCIDAIPIPTETNGVGHFQAAIQSLVATYGGLFDPVSYDASGSS